MLRSFRAVAAYRCAFLLILGACSGGGDSSTATGPGTPSDLTKPTAVAVISGSGQTVRVKSAVASPVTFKVTNAAGSGLASVPVTFSIVAGGGNLATSSATTGADGSVTAPTWTVGSSPVANSVTATVSATLSATATVTARLPYWTVMVYMAADNSLAYFGALNLLQMTQAGVNPEVQVVVQAEFNPQAFAQNGLTPANVDRPNYNTFRYVMDGSVSRPPNQILIGPTTDIGSVNMTDPAQLRAFVQWAEQTAPSQHTVLVLWNHGGDQAGLIEDDTSAPGNLMSLSQLTSALSGLPSFDILYFEMCLMAGYEPLSAVRNIAQTVVASEDEEYVAGWDFNRFLTTMYATPTAPATTIATNLANAFDAGYSTLGFSETISAFNMSGFGAVDGAVSQLATALKGSSVATTGNLATASANVQRYGFAWVADLVNLTDSLAAHTSDQTVLAAITAVKQAATAPSFLLTSHYRTGTQYGQRNESRSHGLTIVMPSVQQSGLPSTGVASVTAYEQQFPNLTWTSFLQSYTSALATQPYVDIGANPLTLWQVWNTSVIGHSWIEMLVLEPNGFLYGPAFGSISPSGVFSADAQVTSANYEGWAADQYVSSGTFNYLAWLVSDPTNLQPLVNVAYQIGGGAVQSLYGTGTYPQLSLATSFLSDPSVSFTKILAGAYTDLKPVATWTPATSSAAMIAQAATASSAAKSAEAAASPQVTAAQLATLRRLSTELSRTPRLAPDLGAGHVAHGLIEALRRAPPNK